MKPAQNPNRQRRPRRMSHNNHNRRSHSGNQNTNPNKHWESLGPNVRIRGSATQIYDKYIGLADDAKRNGDRVLIENLKQHAEHYLRIMNHQQAQRQERAQRQQQAAEKEALEAENNAELEVEAESEVEADSSDDAIVEDLTPKSVVPASDTDDADAAVMD